MRHIRIVTVLLLIATIGSISPAQASVSGRRNTALGATGLAIYELARGRTGTGLLAAAGAGYAWNQYQRAHRRSTRQHSFMQGYRAGIRRAYRAGHRPRYFRNYRRYRWFTLARGSAAVWRTRATSQTAAMLA
jgi:hypothetical protein